MTPIFQPVIPRDYIANYEHTVNLNDLTGTYNLTNTNVTFTGNVWVYGGTATWVNDTFLDAGLTAWSMSIWVKTTMASTRGFIVDKQWTTSVRYPFEFHISSGNKAELYFSGDTTAGLNTYTGTTSINTGAWFSIIMTGDSSARTAIKLYVNWTAEWSLTSSTGGNTAQIGASTDYDFSTGRRADNTEFFTGSMSKLRFYNRVITSTEIAQLAAEPHY